MIIKGYIGNNEMEVQAMKILHTYALSIVRDNVTETQTFHQYESVFPTHVVPYMRIIKHGTIREAIHVQTPLYVTMFSFLRPHVYLNHIETLDDMNELFVSAAGAGGSDRVCVTDHVDGPFFFLPYCTVFRCIVGITTNTSVKTQFPTDGSVMLVNQNEFVAFDYNRDIHSIVVTDTDQEVPCRITLKLHYICYPSFLPRWTVDVIKYIHVKYNGLMRSLFLEAQPGNLVPSNWTGKLLSTCINAGTVIYTRVLQGIYYRPPVFQRN